MSIQGRSEKPAPGCDREERLGADGSWPGRLVQIILALYLTPALLVVLLVGGIGLLVLAAARAITSIISGRGAWPRGPVGPESPAS